MFKMSVLCNLRVGQAQGSPLADHFVLKASAQTGKQGEAEAGVLAAVVTALGNTHMVRRGGRTEQSEVGDQRHRASTHIFPLNASILGPDSRFTDSGQIGACDC